MPRTLKPPAIAITPGEPAGIGPDLCLLMSRHPPADARLVLLADRTLLQARAQQLGLPFHAEAWPGRDAAPGVFVHHIPVAAPVQAGKLNPANASYVLNTLEHAAQRCLDGEFDALVTGPVHKGVINDAGIDFTGHTEFLAQRAGGARVVMMLVADTLRVALATTHVPLGGVSGLITTERVVAVLRIVHAEMGHRFGIAAPRILVCGLNPHAGEGGHLGTEEITAIIPALETVRGDGIDAIGPLPADTIFTPNVLEDADVVVAMYHDQGLPVLKYMGFGRAVNVTLGLPFIRTSVDHGTALARAGTGDVDTGSLRAALALARAMCRP